MDKISGFQEFDREWVELIVLAKNLGLTVEEIRSFINCNKIVKKA